MEDYFFQKIYLLQFISKVVAICPFSIKTQKLSQFWSVYSLLLTALMISISVYQLNVEITDQNKSKLFKFVAFVYIASPTISRTLTCFIIITRYKLLLRFLKNVSQIESVINKILNVPLPKNLYVKFQILMILIIIVVEGIQVFLVYVTNGLIPAVVRGFTIISYLCQAQFVCCVLLLNQYLAVVFDTLSKLEEENSLYSNQISWPEIVGKGNYEEKTVNTCRELVRWISIIKDDINSFFSFPILFIIADSLVLITFNLYLLIKKTSFALNSTETMQQITYLYTVCVNVVQVFFIAFPPAAPGEEVNIYYQKLSLT